MPSAKLAGQLQPRRAGRFLSATRFGAACWLGCLQFFAAEALAALGWRGQHPYSYAHNFISDLGTLGCGATCSRWHALMNISFALQALLIAAGALLLGHVLAGRPGLLARLLLFVSAAGLLCVSLFPSDTESRYHLLGASLHLLLGTAAMLLLALSPRPPLPRWPGLVAGSAALLGDLLPTLHQGVAAAALGLGTTERLAAYPLPLWLAWTGYTLLRPRGADRDL